MACSSVGLRVPIQNGKKNTRTQPDSHYIRYMAASVLKSTSTPEGLLADVCIVSEVLRVVPRCSVLW